MSAIGFEIVNQSEIMGFETFEMEPYVDSTLTFTVYAEDFIRHVSPDVLDMKPSVLFEAANIQVLHEKVAAVTDTVSPIQTEPFPNFNFANPSGHYFAVKSV